jgi:nicotinate-nucleotide pyrophosphorylase (carboxylating)
MQLTISQLAHYFDLHLSEDLGVGGDITSDSVIPEKKIIDFQVVSREEMVVCGMAVSDYYFQRYSSINYSNHSRDKDLVPAGTLLISGRGDAHEILKIERIILNYLQHLSSVATLTRRYVDKVSGYKAKICDTRKTIPGLRSLQKYAVYCGGGSNHRYTLDSGILIKDNHISICGSIAAAVSNAKKYGPHYSRIEVECDTLTQVEESIKAGADIIMLDNMSNDMIGEAVSIIQGKAIIEVSGGVTLENIYEIAKLGVDYISIGRLTHSVPSVDIGLDM